MEDVAESVKVLTSATDTETRKARAREDLLRLSKEDAGIAALQLSHYKELEDLMDRPEERQVAATCLSRILCSNLTEKHRIEWDKDSLKNLRDKFDTTKKGDTKKREKMLKAVQLFAVAHVQVQEKLGLLEATGWMKIALSPPPDSYVSAVALLDALQGNERLPGSIIRAAESADMLAHVIGMGGEPNRLAALRVASQTMSSLGKDSSGNRLRNEQKWLNNLCKARVIKSVLSCIEGHYSESLVDSAVRFLTDLSDHEQFRDEMGNSRMLRAMASKASEMGRSTDSILVLVRRLLTFESVASAFTGIVDPGINGCDLFLAALDEDDLEAANGILNVLLSWCIVRRCLETWDRDLSKLARFLIARDDEVVLWARYVVSWALNLQNEDTSAALVRKLKDTYTAVYTLLSFLAESPLGATYTFPAILRLFAREPDGKTVYDGEACATTFVSSGCTSRVLEQLSAGSAEMIGPAAHLVADLASFSQEIANDFVCNDAIDISINHLDVQSMETDSVQLDVVLAMTTLVQTAEYGLVSARCIGADKEFPALRSLLLVHQNSESPCNWLAFQAIAHIVATDPGSLSASLQADCVRSVVAVLSGKLHDDATKLALETLASVLVRASRDLGQTFLEARGHKLLYSHIKSGLHRNAALMVVLSIANNGEALAGVINVLQAHAGGMDLATICKTYPPVGSGVQELRAVQDRFEAGFNR